jgi:signal transduction histidine kinase
VVYLNRRAETALGKPGAHLLGRAGEEAFAAGLGAAMYRGCQQALLERRAVVFEAAHPLASQTYEVHGSPTADGGLAVSFRDVSERQRAEQQRIALIREQVAREEAEQGRRRSAFLAEASRELAASLEYEATLQSLCRVVVPELADACSVDILDDTGSLRRLAAAGSPSEWLAAGEADTTQPVAPASPEQMALLTGRAQVLSNQTGREPGVAGSLIVVPLRAGGRNIGLLRVVAPRADRAAGPFDMSLAEELAGRAALAIENARLYEAVRAAVAARDEFLSVAAHELKTPVTNVHGFAQLLRRDTVDGKAPHPTRLDRSLTVIEHESAKLGRLVVQLLDVARIEAGKLRVEHSPTDLVGLVRGVAESAALRSGRQSLRVEGPETMIAEVDPLRIEQVMANLVDNALKYSPPESAVWISVQPDVAERVRLVVRDWGGGIPAEKRPHIFDRFYQAHRESHTSGMGLGLWICRQIVGLHNGRIWVEFPEDAGTQVVVELPTGLAGEVRDPAGPPAEGQSQSA